MKNWIPNIVTFVVAAAITAWVGHLITSKATDSTTSTEETPQASSARGKRQHKNTPNPMRNSVAIHVAEANREARNLRTYRDIRDHLVSGGQNPLYKSAMREFLIKNMPEQELWSALENKELKNYNVIMLAAERLADKYPNLLAERIEKRDIPFDDNWGRYCFTGSVIMTIAEKDPEASIEFLTNAASGTYTKHSVKAVTQAICYKHPDFAMENFDRLTTLQDRYEDGSADKRKQIAKLAYKISMSWRQELGREGSKEKLLQQIKTLPQGEKRQI
ncbi:MAG: hypothetical protein ACPG32_15580, partial [Akkermansiaceae bacterium]